MVRRGLRVVLVLAALAGGFAGSARAGYIAGPSGETTNQPTFTAFLEPQEQLAAHIWVASDTQMDSYYIPAHELGSCTPSTPTAAQYTYSCQPSFYDTGDFGGTLPPGTYYYWLTFYRADPGGFISTLHISGPASFTVPALTAPSHAGLVTPADGATVGDLPVRSAEAPAGATIDFYAADSPDRLDDGTPAGLGAFSCEGTAAADSTYTCDADPGDVVAGETYYWWVVLTVDGNRWIYGPQQFTVRAASSGGGGGGVDNGPHTIDDANLLPTSAHFTGRSIKQTRLSAASYAVTKIAGRPKTLAVACWSKTDWPGISGDRGDAYYTVRGFYKRSMPHWLNLSPDVCRGIETLLYHRPLYPNRIVADALDTVTHEMVHAIGVTNEAVTECVAMQISPWMAFYLGVPSTYAYRLAHLQLANYGLHPPRYVDRVRCREGGAWDLYPREPSLPWHMPVGL